MYDIIDEKPNNIRFILFKNGIIIYVNPPKKLNIDDIKIKNRNIGNRLIMSFNDILSHKSFPVLAYISSIEKL